MNAEHARQLLENPLFIEAFENARESIIQGIEDAAIDDAETRNQMGLQLGALSGVKDHIYTYLDTGKLDADEEDRTE